MGPRWERHVAARSIPETRFEGARDPKMHCGVMKVLPNQHMSMPDRAE